MKKILGLIISAATYLTLAPFAFAEKVDVCPDTGIAAALCEFTGADFGQIVGVGINGAFLIAIVAALAYLIYGGIRWILSQGDKSKVADARNHIIAAIIGLVVVFMSYLILSVILTIFGLDINNLELPTLTK